MNSLRRVFGQSLLGRMLHSIVVFFAGQWQDSAVITRFLTPRGWTQQAAGRGLLLSIADKTDGFFCAVYERLGFSRVFGNSILQNAVLFCALPVTLCPILPTTPVIGLTLLATISVLLFHLQSKARPQGYLPVLPYLFLYCIVYFIAILLSVDPRASLLPGLLNVFFALFAVLLCYAIQTRRQLALLIELVIAAATLVALYGILQYLFGWGYQSAEWVDAEMFSSISFRVISTLQNPNMLGQYLVLCIPLCGARLLTAKDWGLRLYYLVSAGILCLCMILTFSRGAWLGLLLAGLVFVAIVQPRLLVLTPVALLLLLLVLPDTVISRFTSIGNLKDQSTNYRVAIWMGAIAMLRDFWLSGIGPGEGAFNLIYPVYSYSGVGAPHAHNLLLQLLCEGGIALVLLFVYIIFVSFRALGSSIRQVGKSPSRIMLAALFAGMTGFLVQAMTDYSFYNYRVMLFFWIYIALANTAASLYVKQEDEAV